MSDFKFAGMKCKFLSWYEKSNRPLLTCDRINVWPSLKNDLFFIRRLTSDLYKQLTVNLWLMLTTDFFYNRQAKSTSWYFHIIWWKLSWKVINKILKFNVKIFWNQLWVDINDLLLSSLLEVKGSGWRIKFKNIGSFPMYNRVTIFIQKQ